MSLHSINAEQRLYVIAAGSGYSCLGFEEAERRRKAVHQWIEQESGVFLNLAPVSLGTPEAYAAYLATMKDGEAFAKKTGKRCPADLTPQLVGLEGKRVEVVTDDGETRRFWVGKSTGWFPIHLQIHNSRSLGGFPVMGAPFKSVRVIRESR